MIARALLLFVNCFYSGVMFSESGGASNGLIDRLEFVVLQHYGGT